MVLAECEMDETPNSYRNVSERVNVASFTATFQTINTHKISVSFRLHPVDVCLCVLFSESQELCQIHT